MSSRQLRVGLVGAGYIAAWHAEALKVRGGSRIVAVCDLARGRAEETAAAYGASAFDDHRKMLAEAACDVVHVLTPPTSHRAVAIDCLGAGAHVLVEKPFALSRRDCAEIAEAARAAGRVAAVNHNFLGMPGYARLKAALGDGRIGPIDAVDVNWRFPFVPLRAGPFGLWPLREPRNLLLELGPHLYAFAHDLCGPLSDFRLDLSKPVALPDGGVRHQSWRVWARGGATDVALNLSLVEGIEDRSVSVRGVAGLARFDYGRDTLTIERANAADMVASPLLDQLSRGGQALREGAVNAVRQIASLNRRSPYALGFIGTIDAVYGAVEAGRPVDPRFSAEAAEAVMGAIEDTLALLPEAEARAPAPAPAPAPSTAAPAEATAEATAETGGGTVLVIGGTGFIGRALTRALVASGRRARVLSRGRASPFGDLGDRVELFAASLDDRERLVEAMRGVEAVVHLAKAEEDSWEAYLRNDVAVVERVAEAALEAGVGRFVYAGTIASYDESRADRPIDEETPFGEMEDRNLYARSKALCEARLGELHASRGLPLVIVRPGVVVGAGGPLQHWGLGRWQGAGAVRLWNDGRNVVPFVLIDDVADAILRVLDAEAEVVTGRSFNLVGEPFMSARDYFDAIRDALGADIVVRPGRPGLFFAADFVKYALKRFALRRRGLTKPSLRDWRGRGHVSPFRNERAKSALGWRPEPDRAAFVRRSVTEAGLFGY